MNLGLIQEHNFQNNIKMSTKQQKVSFKTYIYLVS